VEQAAADRAEDAAVDQQISSPSPARNNFSVPVYTIRYARNVRTLRHHHSGAEIVLGPKCLDTDTIRYEMSF